MTRQYSEMSLRSADVAAGPSLRARDDGNVVALSPVFDAAADTQEMQDPHADENDEDVHMSEAVLAHKDTSAEIKLANVLLGSSLRAHPPFP